MTPLTRLLPPLCLAALLALAFGCEPPRPHDPAPPVELDRGERAAWLVDQIRQSLAAGRPVGELTALLDGLQREIESIDHDNRLLRNEANRLREALALWTDTARVDRLDIRFYTRLIDDKRDGIADRLLAAVTPRDGAGNPIKVPAGVLLELAQKNLLGGVGRVLQSWTFDATEAATHWHSEAVVFPAYEFSLTLDEPTREIVGRRDLILRVTFTPPIGETVSAQQIVKGLSR